MYIDNLACHIYIYHIDSKSSAQRVTRGNFCTFPSRIQAFISVALTAVLSPGFKNSGFLSWKTSRLPGRTNNQTTNQPNKQTNNQPNNQTTKQPNNQPNKQTNKQTNKNYKICTIMTRLSWCHGPWHNSITFGSCAVSTRWRGLASNRKTAQTACLSIDILAQSQLKTNKYYIYI